MHGCSVLWGMCTLEKSKYWTAVVVASIKHYITHLNTKDSTERRYCLQQIIVFDRPHSDLKQCQACDELYIGCYRVFQRDSIDRTCDRRSRLCKTSECLMFAEEKCRYMLIPWSIEMVRHGQLHSCNRRTDRQNPPQQVIQ